MYPCISACGNTDITKTNILKVPAHGQRHRSMKAFSITGPRMWTNCSVDMIKKRVKTQDQESIINKLIKNIFYLFFDLHKRNKI